MKAFALAALLALPAPADAADFVMIGQTGRLAVETLGCPSLDGFKRVLDLAIGQSDQKAAIRFAREAGCDVVNAKQPLQVEDLSALSRASCVRPRGEPHCLWVQTNRVLPSP